MRGGVAALRLSRLAPLVAAVSLAAAVLLAGCSGCAWPALAGREGQHRRDRIALGEIRAAQCQRHIGAVPPPARHRPPCR